ncbi:hypothetical protein SAMN04488553_2529 [Gramella sp. MAR_2010_147]|nr:hypothetical protein SAMN04488553_2529 [Gramella sp. MAR_2010_147]
MIFWGLIVYINNLLSLLLNEVLVSDYVSTREGQVNLKNLRMKKKSLQTF